MAKIYFGKTVKYQGMLFPPNTPFEVLDSEVEDLRQAGGWLVEEEPQPSLKEKAETKKPAGKAKKE